MRRTWKIITLPVLSWLNCMPANKGRLLQGRKNPLSFELEDSKTGVLLNVSWLGSLLHWLFEVYFN